MKIASELEERIEQEAWQRAIDPQTLLETLVFNGLISLNSHSKLRQKMLNDLKTRTVPQSLGELKPRVPTPPGRSAIDAIAGQWPGDETEGELLAALKELDAEAPPNTKTRRD